MAEFKIEIEDKVMDDYMDFCCEMNIDGFALVERFMKAIAAGGGAILEIPMHLSGANMELLVEQIEKKLSNDETDVDAIEEVMSKYLN